MLALHSAAMTQDQWLRYYLQRRTVFERSAWGLLLGLSAAANATTVYLDIRRLGLEIAWWEPLCWEVSSALMWLLLVPFIIRGMDARPLRWGSWRRHLPYHLLFSLLCSLAHVLGMVTLRKLTYFCLGGAYDFGDWPRELAYEALKDVRSYALAVALIGSYRLLLWRWQGEASVLSEPLSPVSAPSVTRPERLLVKKLGTEFLLPVAEIEWVQACGNYVNLHRDGHDYPLRSSMSAFEQRLDPVQFIRIHRSYLVRISLIDAIEPTDAGDAQVRLRGGRRLPCSRTYLDALRQHLVLAV